MSNTSNFISLTYYHTIMQNHKWQICLLAWKQMERKEFKETLGHTLAFTQTDRVRQDTSITPTQTRERPREQEYRHTGWETEWIQNRREKCLLWKVACETSMHRGEKQKSENGTQIRTTTNSEKNMIVKFR